MTRGFTVEDLKKEAKATNDMTSFELFTRRVLYETYAYSEVSEEMQSVLVDFGFQENTFYGRVDPLYRSVIVKDQNLVPLLGAPNQYALNFVADAYGEFIKEIRIAVQNGKIQRDPVLQNLEVKRSYVNNQINQTFLLEAMKNKFLSYVIESGESKKFTNVDKFVPFFQDFILEYVEKNTISTPSFVTSTSYSINSTGLCIDFGDTGFSSDKEKIDFINSPNFEYYLSVAKRYGFYVDRRYPLRIVANLSSPAMKRFISFRGITNPKPSSVFLVNYRLVGRQDLEMIRAVFFNTYQFLQKTRPDIKQVFVQNGSLFTTYIKRTEILPDYFDKKYPLQHWMRFYVKLRNAETKMDFRDQQVRKITANALNLNNTIDKEVAMDYINRVFMGIPISEGSSFDAKFKEYLKRTDQNPDNYLERLKEIYKTR